MLCKNFHDLAKRIFLTNSLSDSVGVVTPLVVGRQHFLQHQQHAGNESSVLCAAELALKWINTEERKRDVGRVDDAQVVRRGKNPPSPVF